MCSTVLCCIEARVTVASHTAGSTTRAFLALRMQMSIGCRFYLGLFYLSIHYANGKCIYRSLYYIYIYHNGKEFQAVLLCLCRIMKMAAIHSLAEMSTKLPLYFFAAVPPLLTVADSTMHGL